MKSVSDTVAVEDQRLIAPPCCMIVPPPECEPRRAQVPGGIQTPTSPTDPSVRTFGEPINIAPVERVVKRGECGAGLMRCDVEWKLAVSGRRGVGVVFRAVVW